MASPKLEKNLNTSAPLRLTKGARRDKRRMMIRPQGSGHARRNRKT